jgi:hypothetical protein
LETKPAAKNVAPSKPLGRLKDPAAYEDEKDADESASAIIYLTAAPPGEHEDTDHNKVAWPGAKAEERATLERNKMLSTHCGRAFLFAEKALDVMDKLLGTCPSTAANIISPVARDELVFLAERMFEKQAEFRKDGKAFLVDLGKSLQLGTQVVVSPESPLSNVLFSFHFVST